MRLAGGSAGGEVHCALRESPDAYQPFSAFIVGLSGGSSGKIEKFDVSIIYLISLIGLET